MPTVTPIDRIYLHFSTSKKIAIAAFSAGPAKHPFPVDDLIRQVTSDRLTLAGFHLRSGDHLTLISDFRSAISRYYYAMYHSARAVVFAEEKGDDFERHAELPRHLPKNMHGRAEREAALIDARLLRNEADYDCYPADPSIWQSDARSLAVIAASFVQSCEEFALSNGHI
ncbi:hypothetical protein [Micromonospora arborensis]|uniref:hypothetical protein n=1 Tax=Micromonospora arborensis TaxID=2116518 RepID=UPI0011B41112|nr:hypothetical protein [Micromonospora arborensis]